MLVDEWGSGGAGALDHGLVVVVAAVAAFDHEPGHAVGLELGDQGAE